MTDAARSGGTERRKRGLPGPYLGGAIALYHRMARKERRHRHSGSSVGISISSRKGRAKIPVGIGAAEGSESDHDEITQLAGTHRRGRRDDLGDCCNRRGQPPYRIKRYDKKAARRSRSTSRHARYNSRTTPVRRYGNLGEDGRDVLALRLARLSLGGAEE